MLAEEVTRSLYEFFVVYIHAVAYICHVYPPDSFKLVRQYGTATYENRHPGVRKWIENAAQSIMRLIYAVDEKASAIVSLTILENGYPSERFGVQISEFVTDKDVQTAQIDETDISEQYRGCLTRLLSLPREPEDNVDRSITVFFEGNIDPSKNEELQDWIPGEAGKDNEVKRGLIKPIRSVEVAGDNDTVLVMNMFRQASGTVFS